MFYVTINFSHYYGSALGTMDKTRSFVLLLQVVLFCFIFTTRISFLITCVSEVIQLAYLILGTFIFIYAKYKPPS